MKRTLCLATISLCANAYAAEASDVSCISSFCLSAAIEDKTVVDIYGPGLRLPLPKPSAEYMRCYYLSDEDAWAELYFDADKGRLVAMIVTRARHCAENQQPKRPMAADFLQGRIRLGMRENALPLLLGKPSQIIPTNATNDHAPLIDVKLGDVVQTYMASEDWCYLVYLKDGLVVGFGMMPPL